MLELIPISKINDFDFCPYSIYLHNVYMDADEDIYHAKLFTEDDSVVIFDVNIDKTEKYGNAIHRDQDIVFF